MILPLPTIDLANGRTSQCDSQTLRTLAIQVPVKESLSYQRWAVLYEKRHYNQANGLFQTMQQASVKIGLRVEEPLWIEVERGDDFYNAELQISGMVEA